MPPFPALSRMTLCLALWLTACSKPSRSPESRSSSAGGSAGSQGVYGTLTALGGARPPPPDCSGASTPAEKDSCLQAGERAPRYPIRGTVIIRNLANRDSILLESDAQGAFRTELAPGSYRACVRDSSLLEGAVCSDTLVVKKGAFTAFDLEYPMP